jgi:TRAP-type C4-dicarboxylate transport system permease small subunit
VRVTILLGVLPPTWVRAVDILATLGAIFFSGFLTYALVQFAYGSWSAGSVSFTPTATPLYIPQTVVAVGAALFTLQLLARVVRLLIGDAPDLPPSSDTPTLEH